MELRFGSLQFAAGGFERHLSIIEVLPARDVRPGEFLLAYVGAAGELETGLKGKRLRALRLDILGAISFARERGLRLGALKLCLSPIALNSEGFRIELPDDLSRLHRSSLLRTKLQNAA